YRPFCQHLFSNFLIFPQFVCQTVQNRQAERAQSTLPTVHLHCYQLKQPLNSWHSIVKSVPRSKLPQLNMASSPPRFWNAPRSRQAVFYRFCRRIANAMIASVLSPR
ncbi:hypothetical protein WKT04_13655, partial [Oscillospiraceae bacterium HCN-4035]